MEKKELTLHAIQLKEIKVVELSIKANEPISEQDIQRADFSLMAGRSEYNTNDHTIVVAVKIEVGDDSTPSPYKLKAELLGIFCVDEAQFDIKYINEFAEKNAPIILYPYLREHVYSLTMRCGFIPRILPLLEVPTLKITKIEDIHTE